MFNNNPMKYVCPSCLDDTGGQILQFCKNCRDPREMCEVVIDSEIWERSTNDLQPVTPRPMSDAFNDHLESLKATRIPVSALSNMSTRYLATHRVMIPEQRIIIPFPDNTVEMASLITFLRQKALARKVIVLPSSCGYHYSYPV